MTGLKRYGRHLVLPEIGVAGQETLRDSHALIIGAGGLGSAAALYLAAAGVGQISIADHDALELSNLQRQILYRESDLGQPKVQRARQQLTALNSDIQVHVINTTVTADNLPALLRDVDIVLDGSDNFPTRFAVNAACVSARKPLVSGAAIRFEGQLAVFTPGNNDSPCYRCLYPDAGEMQESCENAGILGPLVGVIGSLQALEAIKLLLGLGLPSAGQLLLFDALTLAWRKLRLQRDPHCPVCGAAHD